MSPVRCTYATRLPGERPLLAAHLDPMTDQPTQTAEPVAEQTPRTVLEPKGAHHLSGWTEITCWQAEIVRRCDLSVGSSRHGGAEGFPSGSFIEWWTPEGDPRYKRSVPVLREYRGTPGMGSLGGGAADGCRHYLAGEPAAAAYERDIDD